MSKISLKTTRQQISVSFVGEYEATVLGDERIGLPTSVVGELRDNGIRKLLVGRLPRYNALILCPEALWTKWTNGIRRKFPCLKSHDGARAFLVPWQSIHWDARGRMSLPKRAKDYAGIRAYGTVIIVGTEYYLELWMEEEFVRITQECQNALGT